MSYVSRRSFIKTSVAASTVPFTACQGQSEPPQQSSGELHLGLVTYLLAKEWDIDTIIKNCTETDFEAVELRSTHAHGVEITISKDKRADVRKRFEDSPITLASLGSACEYDAVDPAVVQKNIEETKAFVILAHDVGAKGVKVRPNRLHEQEGIPRDQTIAQIAQSLQICGDFAKDYGVELRVECHGRGTSNIPVMKQIFDQTDHDMVWACWNSNPVDMEDGGWDENFNMLKDRIHFVHMRDLFADYPWRKLLNGLRENGYSGYCCAEIPASSDPIRVMHYYRTLFQAYQNIV
jgi:sugar phosphate isomerase/epimerase